MPKQDQNRFFFLRKLFVSLIWAYSLLPNETLHLGIYLNRFPYEEKVLEVFDNVVFCQAFKELYCKQCFVEESV